ncbi:glycosyltransferase family 2 protein [Candidatus Gottesmanbacteria bacterium]|nr:glycosyltransferase family 2 protein [Candidatus Gottesmanbacteria bacterium]
MKPKITIAMFVYNEEKHVGEAIESLLCQTYRDFQFLILDDVSTDHTPQIIAAYKKKNKRIRYFQNEKRMGYIYNYRKTYELGGKNADYFTWAAGHDVYHPEWLSHHVEVLQKYPEVVMAYPLTVRIDGQGKTLPVKSDVFETFGLSAPQCALTVAAHGKNFGNMIYGLLRANKIPEAGIFRYFLLPDVLFLLELSLHGTFKQVKRKLWYRRYVDLFSIERQRRIAFYKHPWYLRIPWPVTNSFAIFWYQVLVSKQNDFYIRYIATQVSILFFIRSLPKLQRDSRIIGKYVILPYLNLSQKLYKKYDEYRSFIRNMYLIFRFAAVSRLGKFILHLSKNIYDMYVFLTRNIKNSI